MRILLIVAGVVATTYLFGALLMYSRLPVEEQLDPWSNPAAVLILPDCDGDRLPEILLGDPTHAPLGGGFIVNNYQGRVLLYSSATGEVLREIQGPFGRGQFGRSLALLDDDNPKRVLVAIGQPGALTHERGLPFAYRPYGRVLVHEFPSGLELARLEGERRGDQFGFALATWRKAQTNQPAELVVAAPSTRDIPERDGRCLYKVQYHAGQLSFDTDAFPYRHRGLPDDFGTSLHPILTKADSPASEQDLLVASFSTIFQLREDSAEPVQVYRHDSCAWYARAGLDSVVDNPQTVRFASGNSCPSGDSIGFWQVGVREGEHVPEPEPRNLGFGRSVLWIEDFDGDQRADWVVGCPGYDGKMKAATLYGLGVGVRSSAAEPMGRVLVLASPHGAVLREIVGEKPWDGFGSSLARYGDYDGDGHKDVVVLCANPQSDYAGWVVSLRTGKRLLGLRRPD